MLALGPALSRMRFVDNGRPYEKLIQGGHDEHQQQQTTTGRIKSNSSSSTSSSRFWAGVSWRRKKTSKKKKKLVVEKLGNKNHERRRRLHFKVSKQLRIRLLMSPLLLLKKLRDSYVRMILALERDCGEYGGALAMSSYPIYPLYLFA